MPEGIILKGIGGFYYVKVEETIYECKARGVFRKNDITPLPGDRVQINIVSEEAKKGNVEEILTRKSFLIRPAVANVDIVFATVAVKSPVPDLLLLDKILISAALKDISAVICVNKADLDDNLSTDAIKKAYEIAGYRVLVVSKFNENSYNEILKEMTSKINVFAGQSGVGKSSILNSIVENEVMETGSISEKIERGKHTTRHAQLIELKGGGYVVDTPGFSSYELESLDPLELQDYYPEFQQYIGECRFAGCAHVNEPNCAVKSAKEAGLIDSGRYDRYLLLYNQLLQLKNNKYKK